MNRHILSGSTIKIIAVITMFIDHFGKILLKNGIVINAPYSAFSDYQFSLLLKAVDICHILGRIAFPLFCFLLVEGFIHTHNLKKYIISLGILAIISEPIYDLSFGRGLFSFDQQNVIFTLLLGVLMLALIRKCNDNLLITVAATTICGIASYLLQLDGWYYGIALIAILYYFREHDWLKYLLVLVAMYVCGLDFSLQALIDPYFLTAASSIVIMALYNGKRGLKMKYFFYIFYPLHLLVLHIIAASITTLCF